MNPVAYRINRQLRAKKGAVWVALALLIGLSGCASGGPVPPGGDGGDRAREERESQSGPYLRGKDIGRQFMLSALGQYRFHTDYDVAAYVQQIGRTIAAASGANPDTYHFFVVQNPQANAFAIPGGYIFVFDGLLKRLSDEEELAGVLAHEVAHVRHNHFFKDRKKVAAADLAVIAAILLGQGGEAVTTFSLAGAASLQLAYSRENERESDMSALDYLREANYDPAGMARFFGVLRRQERLVLPRGEFSYLSTHPGLAERYDRVMRLIVREARTAPPPRPETKWDRMQATLAAQSIIDRNVAGGPFRRGLVELKASRFDQALPLLEQAVREEPERVDARAALAECLLRLDRMQPARMAYDEATRLDPDSLHARFVGGEIARHVGKRAAAVAAYRRVLEIDPAHPLSHFRLAQLLKEEGEAALSGWHMARYLRLTLHPAQAHATLKGIDPQGDETLAEKIRDEMTDLAREGI